MLPIKEEIIRRKKVMQSAGISVPNTDESWGPWWEKQWQKAITHPKQYGKPSVWNFGREMIDKITNNTIYQAEPQPISGTIQATDMSTTAQIKRTLNNWQHESDPVRDITLLLMPDSSKPIKVGKAVVKAAPQVVKTVPKLFTKEGAKKAGIETAKFVARETPKAVVGYLGGKGVDAISEAVTGKSWSEKASDKMSDVLGFHVDPIFGEVINPGYGYGYFVGNNFSNLGRYTLDNLRPFGYSFDKTQLKGLANIYTEPFYKKPPTFFEHRPKWYKSDDMLRARFENGANWANIPESEVPRVYFRRNPEGFVEPTQVNSLANYFVPEPSDFEKVGKSIELPDWFTPGGVGGEHSNYTYLGDITRGPHKISFYEFSDRQQLNPQWILSDKLKKSLKLKRDSKPFQLVHKLGGINLSRLLGYKPFTIKSVYGVTTDATGEPIINLVSDQKYVKEILKNP